MTHDTPVQAPVSWFHRLTRSGALLSMTIADLAVLQFAFYLLLVLEVSMTWWPVLMGLLVAAHAFHLFLGSKTSYNLGQNACLNHLFSSSGALRESNRNLLKANMHQANRVEELEGLAQEQKLELLRRDLAQAKKGVAGAVPVGPDTHPIAWEHHQADLIARAFHARYEARAPEHGYKTRPDSAGPWEDIPNKNKDLMVEVVEDLLHIGAIVPGDGLLGLVSLINGPDSAEAIALDLMTSQALGDLIEEAEKEQELRRQKVNDG